MFKFFARQPFWVHLVTAILLVFLMVFLFLQSLSWFTNHGSYLKVPVVKGKNVDVAVKQLEDQGFEVVIQDSLYFDTIPKYTVIKQLPEPDATVKANRTVYLTINRAVPPDISMPNLEGLSLAYALDKLDRMHLKLGDTVYKPDFMKGSVLEQQYNSSRVAAGTKVPWGSRINLVIGAGLQEQQMLVPEVVGLTFADAKAILESKGISLAAIIPMSTVKDTAGAFVYKQNPEKYDADNKPVFMQPGQTMDLWLSPVPLDVDSIKVKNEQELQ